MPSGRTDEPFASPRHHDHHSGNGFLPGARAERIGSNFKPFPARVQCRYVCHDSRLAGAQTQAPARPCAQRSVSFWSHARPTWSNALWSTFFRPHLSPPRHRAGRFRNSETAPEGLVARTCRTAAFDYHSLQSRHSASLIGHGGQAPFGSSNVLSRPMGVTLLFVVGVAGLSPALPQALVGAGWVPPT